jgi:hypothetical protein
MNTDEADRLVKYLKAAGVLSVDTGTVAAWAMSLDDIRFTDAEVAAVTLVKRSHGRVAIADIRDEVRRIRDQRLADTEIPVPNADPSDVPAYNAELRRIYTAIADGTFDREAYEARRAIERPREMPALGGVFPSPPVK